MTLLIVAAIWSLAVGGILLFFKSATKNRYTHPIEEMNFQDNPPVMWDEIPYNLN